MERDLERFISPPFPRLFLSRGQKVAPGHGFSAPQPAASPVRIPPMLMDDDEAAGFERARLRIAVPSLRQREEQFR